MTVKYNLDVSTSRPWTLFKLLFKWRGSVWKSVTLELAIWLLFYMVISAIYRFVLNPQQMRILEQISHYLDDRLSYIPIDFMLGFFITSVLNRWIIFFDRIGFIDNIALMVAAYVHGDDEKTRSLRRNIVRYCVLSQALVFRDIDIRVRKRFPTLDSVVSAGFMMGHEKDKFEEIQYRYAKYWMPFQWSLALCEEAFKQKKISSDVILEKVGEEIKIFRTNLAILCNYDWVPLPIMYPQLIVIAVHIYFFLCTVARQHIISDHAPNKSVVDMYFPFMTVLQFIFYMGWLKVAEVMLNPFGEDDDDFECNFLLDRNLTIGLTIVDDGYNKPPQILRDVYWNRPVEPLYSEESVHRERSMSGVTGSVAHITLHERKGSKMLPLLSWEEAKTSQTHAVRKRRASKADFRGHESKDPEELQVEQLERSISHCPLRIDQLSRLHFPPSFLRPHSFQKNELDDNYGINIDFSRVSRIDETNDRSTSTDGINFLPHHILEVLKEENELTLKRETIETHGGIPFPMQMQVVQPKNGSIEEENEKLGSDSQASHVLEVLSNQDNNEHDNNDQNRDLSINSSIADGGHIFSIEVTKM